VDRSCATSEKRVTMGLIKKFSSLLINFTIFFLIVSFSPGLPPKTTFPFEEFR
jgi:adipocyte plasma membrane-associated protein